MNCVPELKRKLAAYGLRPTRQRVQLLALLNALGDTHVTPAEVHLRLKAGKTPVSLATVYNNLKEFADRELVRRIVVTESQIVYDTNLKPHHHIIDEDKQLIVDTDQIVYSLAPGFELPAGQEISSVEVTIRSRAKRN